MPYVLVMPPQGSPLRGVALLLPGGDGRVKLDARGCSRALAGNFLVRSAGLFREAGYITALVDAPSDHRGPDGLAGFRNTEAHAKDLGVAIAGLRTRFRLPVWVVGTSRGTISASNAASRLAGDAAPDGVVLSSVLSTGSPSAKTWTAQTVFDLVLAAVKVPALVLGHADDTCRRSPPGEMDHVLQELGSTRKASHLVEGARSGSQPSGDGACEGRSPHGYFGQEAEAVGAIVRFMAAS